MHCYSAEEQDDFLIFADSRFAQIHVAIAIMVNSVIHHFDFFGAEAIATDYDVSSEIADGNYFIRCVHSRTLDVVNHLVDVLATSVEFGGMDVHNQGFAAACCHLDSGGICHPVMGMHDVKFLIFGQFGGDGCVTVDLGVHITGVVGWADGADGCTAPRPCFAFSFFEALLVTLRGRIRLQK
ncbi:hypothetical protein ES703_42568 [subsurface metagenome]